MFIKLTRYGDEGTIHVINLDNVIDYHQPVDKEYVVLRLRTINVEGKYKEMWVKETMDMINKALAHFIVAKF